MPSPSVETARSTFSSAKAKEEGKDPAFSVLFVCLGNICRSPTAEAIFASLVEREGLSHRIRIESAGTAGWHEGKAPDPRSTETARRRGIPMRSRSRPIHPGDFKEFDLILAMDRENLADLRNHPARGEGEMRLFLSFDPKLGEREVPDPYHGGARGFEEVFDLIADGAEALLSHLRDGPLATS